MSPCEQLEDFLDEQLSPSDVQAFQAHLISCDSCRNDWEAHQEFQRLVAEVKVCFDGKLASRHAQLRDTWHKVVHRRRMVAIGSTAVASLAVSACLAFVFLHSPRDVMEGMETVEVSSESSTDSQHVPPVAGPQPAMVSMEEDSPYLAVPMESANPELTIYWLHPIVKSDLSDDSTTVSREFEALLARSSL